MFTIKERIAVGGMAEVYRVERTDAAGNVQILALKKMLQGRDETLFVKALLREARIAGDLDHPNIVKVIESGELQGSPFVLMEYVDGVDLASVLGFLTRRKAKIPLEVSLTILEAVARGLAYAHARGVIHRDVSPPNILISKDGAIKITDFGIAKAASNNTRTPFGTLKGKLLYMSPEQLKGGELQSETDIFSLGVVAYELLTGIHPFEARTEVEIIDRIRRFDVTFEGAVWEKIPTGAAGLCKKAMAAEPGARFANGGELADEIASLRRQLSLPDGTTALTVLILEVSAARAASANKGDRPPTLKTKKLEMHTITRGREPTAILRAVPQRWKGRRWIGLSLVLLILLGGAVLLRKTFLEDCEKGYPRDPVGCGAHTPLADGSGRIRPTAATLLGPGLSQKSLTVGTLTILAQPWGRVTLAGLVDEKISPVHLTKIAAGEYRVEVRYNPGESSTEPKLVVGTAMIESARGTLCAVNFLDPAPKLKCRIK